MQIRQTTNTARRKLDTGGQVYRAKIHLRNCRRPSYQFMITTKSINLQRDVVYYEVVLNVHLLGLSGDEWRHKYGGDR